MLACRILNILIAVFAWVVVPVQFVTTAVGGCLVSCTFGLLLLPLSLVWLILAGLLVGTSWLWEQAGVLRVPPLVAIARIPIAVIGIPLALLSEIYVCLVPSMGELESRLTKLITCWVWPFSLDYWRFYILGRPLDSADAERRYYQLQEAAPIAGIVLPPLAERATHVPYEERLREDSAAEVPPVAEEEAAEEEQPPVEEGAPEVAEEEQPSATTPTAPAQPPGPVCPNCGYHDDGGRTSCPHCGMPLAPP